MCGASVSAYGSIAADSIATQRAPAATSAQLLRMLAKRESIGDPSHSLRPHRVLLAPVCLQELAVELVEPPGDQRRARVAHQAQAEAHIVDGGEHLRGRARRAEKMVQIAAAHVAAGVAVAAGVDRDAVLGVARLLDVENPARR